MMNYFTKEVKIALTACAAIVLLFIGLNFLKGINVFTSTNTYYVKFSDVAGLTVSTQVYANGYPVGNVRSIEYDYKKSGGAVVCIELDDAMRVPAGTRSELQTELMGGVKMNLVLGPNPANCLTPSDTIEGGMYVGSLNKLEAMIPMMEKMLPKLDSIMSNLNRLTADPALAQTLQNTAAITSNLKETSGELNRMMKKDVPRMIADLGATAKNTRCLTDQLASVDMAAMAKQVNATLDNAEQLTANLNKTTLDLQTKLNSRENSLGLLLNDPAMYNNLNATLSSANDLMVDLKQNPKRYVHFSVFGKKQQ